MPTEEVVSKGANCDEKIVYDVKNRSLNYDKREKFKNQNEKDFKIY